MYGTDNWLDLQTLFVNEIAGSAFIFLLLSYIMIFYLATRFRFPNIVTLVFMLVFTLVVSPFLSEGLLIISLFIVAIYFGINLYRTWMKE